MSGSPKGEHPSAPSARVPRWQLVMAGLLLAFILASPAWGPRLLRRFDFFRVRKFFLQILAAVSNTMLAPRATAHRAAAHALCR